MSSVQFVGIDASMSNIGLVHGAFSLAENAFELKEIQLIQTFPSQEKKVRKSSVDYERCREAHLKMHHFLKAWKPSICFAEMPTGSQSANGMKSYGISLMLLATIMTPVIQVSPQEVKVAAVDSKNASKETIIKWAVDRWPDLDWHTRVFKGKTELLNRNEHMADACAAVVAGMKTNQWLQLVAMLRGQSISTML